jgi:large subunit ribosomal protein L4
VRPTGRAETKVGHSDPVLVDTFDENLYLSSRNLTNALVVEARFADPVSLVHFPKVIATTEAVKQLEEMFG